MRNKSPNCPYCDRKMIRIYGLKTGVKTWVTVGWLCPDHKIPELDVKDFSEMGLGASGSVPCPKCELPTKVLYSQIKGKNQMKRIKGINACFNVAHKPCTIPRGIGHEEAEILRQISEVLRDDESAIILDAFEKGNGVEYTDKVRQMLSVRSIHDQVRLSWGYDNKKSHRIKIAHSDGSIGDFISPPGFEKTALKVEKDKNFYWTSVMGMLKLIGVWPSEVEQEVNRIAYLNTSQLIWFIVNRIEEVKPAVLSTEREYLSLEYIMKSANTIYGFLFAHQAYRDNMNEELDSETRLASGSIFIKLMLNKFDLRAIYPKNYLYPKLNISVKSKP